MACLDKARIAANAKKPFFWKDHLTSLLTSADARAGFEALLPVTEAAGLEDLNKPVRQQRPVLQRFVTVAPPFTSRLPSTQEMSAL